MMNKNPEIFDDDLKLENLLKPRVEFHVSSCFKQRVMAEARVIPVRSRRKILLVASSAAAAVSTLLIITAVCFHITDSPADQPLAVASTEIAVLATIDSLYKETETTLLAEAPQTLRKTPTGKRRSKCRKPATKTHSSPGSINKDSQMESEPQPVSEGEMPMISRESSLDPDEVRARLLQTRRNAEIAYIEHMRDEIETNQANITQLMAEVNVIQ